MAGMHVASFRPANSLLTINSLESHNMLAVPTWADADLLKRVRIFLDHARIELRSIDVQVNDGVVVLSGTVPTYYVRQLATACARRVAGVRNVVDDLEVVYVHKRDPKDGHLPSRQGAC